MFYTKLNEYQNLASLWNNKSAIPDTMLSPVIIECSIFIELGKRFKVMRIKPLIMNQSIVFN